MEISTSLVGLEPTISRLHTEFHYSSCLRSSWQGISNISIYQGLQTKKLYTKMPKNVNWICPMTAILNTTICGKTVSSRAWHTAEMDSAQNIHIETTNEVLFLKNAYGSLFRAIFQFFVLTIYICMSEWASYQIRTIVVAHAPGMPGRFSQPPRVNDPDIHHGTCLTQVPWCMPGSLTSGCHWSGWRGKLSRHSRCTRNPHFNLSCERPMVLLSHYVATRDCCNEIIFSQL